MTSNNDINGSNLNQKYVVGDPINTDTPSLFKIPSGEGVPVLVNVPEWYQGETVAKEKETPITPVTLSDLFKRYRGIDDKLAELRSQVASLSLQMAPLVLALQDQQELIDKKLVEQGIEKGKLEGYVYTYTNAIRTVITDESLLPDECWTPKPDAAKIKKFLQTLSTDERDDYGAQLQTTKNLSIKPLTDKDEEKV